MVKPNKPTCLGGRPTKYREEFHCTDFIEQSKQGKTITQIASSWDINLDSLYEWKKVHPKFSEAIKIGRQHAEAWYMNLGQAAITGQTKVNNEPVPFNLGVFCWMTKNMFKWSDRVDTSPQNAKGNEENPCKQMTDDELENA